jgi:hypothetical protein
MLFGHENGEDVKGNAFVVPKRKDFRHLEMRVEAEHSRYREPSYLGPGTVKLGIAVNFGHRQKLGQDGPPAKPCDLSSAGPAFFDDRAGGRTPVTRGHGRSPGDRRAGWPYPPAPRRG